MSDSDLDQELADLYAEMEAAEQGSDGEMKAEPPAPAEEPSYTPDAPQAGEAEGQTNKDNDHQDVDPVAGEAEGKQADGKDQGKPPDENTDEPEFKPAGRYVPIERFTDLRRTSRKLEKAKHGVEKQLGETQAELAQLKARLAYAEQAGNTVPDLPDGINMEAVQEGDPEAMRDALVYMQHTINELRGGHQQGSGFAEPPSGDSPNADTTDTASSPASWDEFIYSLPPDSPVHDLDGWLSSGDPVLIEAAKTAEQQLLGDPQYAQNLESLYSEVVNRVKAQLSQPVEQQLQQNSSQQPVTPRSLSQAAGQAGGHLSLVEQFSQADDPDAFFDNLPESQQQALWAELGM